MSVASRAAMVAAPVCPIPERINEMTLAILNPFPALQEKARTFFTEHGHVFDRLAECRRIVHVRNVIQLGVKQDDMLGRYQVSRWLHSKHVAAHMAAIGIKLGLSDREILVGVLGALLHDVGYGAFSHDSDYFLEQNGYRHHEERGKAIILGDEEIGSVFREAGVHAQDVHNVVAEVGILGQLQKFCDTGAYVVLDSLVYGMRVPKDMSGKYVDSILAVAGNEIVVSNRSPLKWAIRRRGELSKRYFSHMNKLTTAGLVKSLQYLYDHNFIALNDVALHDDQTVRAQMLDIAGKVLVPEWWRSLARLTFGDLRELPRWKGAEFATKIDRAAYVGGLSAMEQASMVPIDLWDYTSKVLTVIVNGKRTRLKAHESILRPCDTQYYAYTFVE